MCPQCCSCNPLCFPDIVLDIVNSQCIRYCLLGIEQCMHATADFSAPQWILAWCNAVMEVLNSADCAVQIGVKCKGTILWRHCQSATAPSQMERPTLPFENACKSSISALGTFPLQGCSSATTKEKFWENSANFQIFIQLETPSQFYHTSCDVLKKHCSISFTLLDRGAFIFGINDTKPLNTTSLLRGLFQEA